MPHRKLVRVPFDRELEVPGHGQPFNLDARLLDVLMFSPSLR